MPDLSQPVSDILHEISATFLRPQLQPEILTGVGNLPRFLLAEAGPLYGAVFDALVIPPYLGHTAGDEPEYFEELLGLRFVAPFNGGAQLTTRRESLHFPTTVLQFTNLGFTTCIYSVLPGVQITWSYLKLILP